MLEVILSLSTLTMAGTLIVLSKRMNTLSGVIIELRQREYNYQKRLDDAISLITKTAEKQKKDVADIKRRLKDQEKKIGVAADKYVKSIEEIRNQSKGLLVDVQNSHKNNADQCKKIVHEAEEAVKNVGKIYISEADKVIKWVRDIARDFYQVAAVLKSGKIKEMAIISEETYLQYRGIPAKGAKLKKEEIL